jgi:adenine phosphoribosyltransferase
MDEKLISKLKQSIRDIPDYPKPGIIFKDITTLLKDPALFSQSIDLLYQRVRHISIDMVAAVESRGFIFGAVLAQRLQAGFIPVRKPGKLPAEVISEEYALEYGTDRLEMHKDALSAGNSVLIVDDLLATGGTARAACKLVERSGANVAALLFLIELDFLNGRQLLENYQIHSLINF